MTRTRPRPQFLIAAILLAALAATSCSQSTNDRGDNTGPTRGPLSDKTNRMDLDENHYNNPKQERDQTRR